MRAFLLVGLGLVAAAALAITPVAAQASTSGGSSPATARLTTADGRLTPAGCTAMRKTLGDPALDCAYVLVSGPGEGTPAAADSARPAEAAAADAASSKYTYYTGFLAACSGDCALTSSKDWRAVDDFGDTFENKVGVWNNSHRCIAAGDLSPGITWCGTWHSGYANYMEEGLNFGNGGWARLEIDTYGNYTPVAPSWVHTISCNAPPGECGDPWG